ncbi:hypothetical protein [Blattabacterium cuenoti]|uniref:hypothetical protein n=1 Tax=Blattabacterium cuenoti TaxID=1653831 RepID=UPI001EEA3DD8|nr:hypothetical protein [Blattabacterium cuenoti]
MIQKYNNKKIRRSNLLKSFVKLFFLLVFFLFFSCTTEKKNFIKLIKNKKRKEIPHRIFLRTSILSKENGIPRLFMNFPIMEEYSISTLFPKGIQLFFFDKKNTKEYISLTADWVKSTEKIFYHIKGNIRVVSSNGYFLKTDEIFWNRKQKKIFNNKCTIIYYPDGTMLRAMNGLEASDDFKNISLKNISGIIPI